MSKIFTKAFYTAAVTIFFLAAAIQADAQFIKTNIETGGLYSALAKDGSNNTYAIRVTAGSGGASGEVVKYIGGTGTATVIYSGLHEGDDTGPGGDLPWGLAVTSTGDVYISTDFFGTSKIIKLKHSSTAYTPSTFQSGGYFTALAVDASDNLYATQFDGTSHYAIYKYAANSAGGTPGAQLYDGLKQAAGYSYPTGLAVAANGDIYVTDAFSNDSSLPADGGRILKLTAASGFATAVTVSNGHYPTALALDAAGNLFATENRGTDNNSYKIYKYTNATGTPAVLYTPLHTNGIYYPFGIVAFSATNIFAIDGDDGTSGGTLSHFYPPSSNATLASLTYNPSFTRTVVSGPDFKDYTGAVSNSVASVKVTPTTTDAGAIVTVNGVTVPSGTPSAAIPLVVGANTIQTVVTSQDGSATNTYSIVITRQGPPILTSLTYNPSFSRTTVAGPDYKDYTGTVPSSVTSVKVSPVAQDPASTIKVNGVTVASGAASAPIPLSIGDNTINTVVTSGDGYTSITYSIVITRTSNVATLNSLTYTPPFTVTTVTGPDFADYTGAVGNDVTSVVVSPTRSDPNSTVTVNGATVLNDYSSNPIALSVGANTINTVVTAQDGVTKNTYSIVITRQGSNVATLTALTYNPSISRTTVSGPDYRDYTATVASSLTSIKVNPTATDPESTIRVNGVVVASGATSAAIPLNIGTTVINTVITGSDGVTANTYSISIYRPSNVATLSALTYNPSFTRTQVAGPDFKDYTASVANSVSSVKVTATTTDPNSTVTVNGLNVKSGAASASIALNVGDNTINTVVTAQDGTTINTYSIVITRAPASAFAKFDEKAVSPAESVVKVRESLSPNGDGVGDFLVIDGIASHPDNTLTIMSRSGLLVYQAKGYDNAVKVFNGHSSINGKMQQAGTYFYSLDYKAGDETRHKTGFIILKY